MTQQSGKNENQPEQCTVRAKVENSSFSLAVANIVNVTNRGVRTREETLKSRVPQDAHGQLAELRRDLSDDSLDGILKRNLLIWSHSDKSLFMPLWARLLPWYAWAQLLVLTGLLVYLLYALWVHMALTSGTAAVHMWERGLLLGFIVLCVGAMEVLRYCFIVPQKLALRAEALLVRGR